MSVLEQAELRDLYNKQREVALLESIAVAANEAATQEDAVRFALNRICEHTHWPLGHIYYVSTCD